MKSFIKQQTAKKNTGLRLGSRLFILCILMLLLAIPVSAATITKSEDDSFSNVAVCEVSGGKLNVRSKASTDGTVVGTMTNHSAAIIKKTVDGEDGKWYYISSGSVTGYVKASYFLTGDKAKAAAKKYGTACYAVDVTTLKLRSKASTSASVLAKLSEGTSVKIVESGISAEGMKWSKVKATVSGETVTGYVAEKYIGKAYSLSTAAAKEGTDSSSSKSSSSGSKSSSSKSSSSKSSSSKSDSSSSKSSSKGSKIVAKAKSYVGKVRYVYGGTSLRSGVDCSGFTRAIYKACGISLSRTAKQQARGGRSIKKSQLQPGDLVFYKRGGRSINHVAIYIGGGKIVHAANKRKGVCISSMTYMKPCKYVTYTH